MRKLLLALLLFLASIKASPQMIMIYGGENHKVFLGYLNANNYESKSIWNTYGYYGNKYGDISIWNDYGTYGSGYSDYSPFNVYATDPPVLVDKEGNFYGYFTVNTSNTKRTKMGLALYILKYYDLIRDNIDGWYKKIFDS